MENNDLYTLMHLTDSALPTGSFAYSFGLESAFKTGMILSMADFEEYLEAYIDQVCTMELPYLKAAYDLDYPDEMDKLIPLADEYSATILVTELHDASVAQGKNWLRLMEMFYKEYELLHFSRTWFFKRDIPPHFTIVFALCAKVIGLPFAIIQQAFLYAYVRDQVSAAVRLGFCGPLEGHTLQHLFLKDLYLKMEKKPTIQFNAAFKSGVLIDLAQASHKQVYSKLFQN